MPSSTAHAALLKDRGENSSSSASYHSLCGVAAALRAEISTDHSGGDTPNSTPSKDKSGSDILFNTELESTSSFQVYKFMLECFILEGKLCLR